MKDVVPRGDEEFVVGADVHDFFGIGAQADGESLVAVFVGIEVSLLRDVEFKPLSHAEHAQGCRGADKGDLCEIVVCD